jgi:hypothetical protein
MSIEATIYLNSSEIKSEVVPHIVTKNSYKTIMTDKPVPYGDGNQHLYLVLRAEDISTVKEYFEEIKKQTDALKSRWMTLNLGACFNSDYACHYWSGDESTPLQQVIEEGKRILSCCYREDVMEDNIKKAYLEYWHKKKKAAEKRAEREKLFEEAKAKGMPVKLYSYSIECQDQNEDCDLDIVTVYAMPDGKIKEEVSHTW